MSESHLSYPSNRVTFVLHRNCQPPDGSTSPKYKLLCFITTKKICKEKNALAFNKDRCCHLVLCLRLLPFHCAIAHLLGPIRRHLSYKLKILYARHSGAVEQMSSLNLVEQVFSRGNVVCSLWAKNGWANVWS